MNIAHYSIGYPPHKNGGTARYAESLSECEAEGNNVYRLSYGSPFLSRIPKIVRKGKEYEMTGSSLVPINYGVRDPESILGCVGFDKASVDAFLKETGIEILHIHTFMGLPKSVVGYIRSCGVKIIYTTHDFFGLCPRGNFIDNTDAICSGCSPAKCALCNSNAPSAFKLKLASSDLYRLVKNIGFIKRKAAKQVTGGRPEATVPSAGRIKAFEHLSDYYKEYFDLIDMVIFNSSQTRDIFNRHVTLRNSTVIPVTLRGIADNRRRRLHSGDCIRLAFIGSTRNFRGFPNLKKALMELEENGIDNWELNVWEPSCEGKDPECGRIVYRGGYSREELPSVFDGTDLLVVPSVCYETFSLTTLEAVSFGVPALVSDSVGAKEIVEKINPDFVFRQEDLKDKLQNILANPVLLDEFSTGILSPDWKYSIEEHTKAVLETYKR